MPGDLPDVRAGDVWKDNTWMAANAFEVRSTWADCGCARSDKHVHVANMQGPGRRRAISLSRRWGAARGYQLVYRRDETPEPSCPHVVTDPDGTAFCALSEQQTRALEVEVGRLEHRLDEYCDRAADSFPLPVVVGEGQIDGDGRRMSFDAQWPELTWGTRVLVVADPGYRCPGCGLPRHFLGEMGDDDSVDEVWPGSRMSRRCPRCGSDERPVAEAAR